MPPRKRKSTTRKRQSGKGVRSVLRKAHSIVKNAKVVSRVLRHRGHSIAADVVDQLGYGRKKRRRRASKGSLLSLPRRVIRAPKARSRRTRRVGQLGRGVVMTATPSFRDRAMYPAGQTGNGIIGKVAGGLFSALFPW